VVCLLAGSGLLVALRSVELRGQDPTAAPTAVQRAAQPAAQPHPTAIRSVVVLDPAHGGTDPGADLGNKVAEKDVTLALATKLRAALAAQGFTVVLTRDADATAAVTSDQRAQTANRNRPMACVSLHATRSGSGVHIYTSALEPVSDSADSGFLPARWDTVQARFVAESTQLAAGLKAAFDAAGLPAEVRTATVPPIDSLTCPAIAIEFAPIQNLSTPGKTADDASYHDSAAKAIAAALGKWRTDTAPQPQPAASSAKEAQ
jgi:N-acetylmuramoyl-L-alanine amidase